MIWLIVAEGVPVFGEYPLRFGELLVHIQLHFVPGTLVVRVRFVEVLLQILLFSGLLEIVGVGYTATL